MAKTHQQIKPTPAHGSFPKHSNPWEDEDWIAEPKIDGERILYHIGGGLLKPALTSKHLGKHTGVYAEKADNVPDLWMPRDQQMRFGYTVFDMEIMHHVNTHSVLGGGPEKALAFQKKHGPAQGFVFDLLVLDGEEIRQKALKIRRAFLEQFLSSCPLPNVSLLQQITEDRKGFYDSHVAKGGEGVILKHLYESYNDCRWIKVKEEIPVSTIIMGYKEGTGRNAGMVGSICVGVLEDGELIEIGKAGGLSDENRKLISDNRDYYLGKVLDVKAQTLTKKTSSFKIGGRLRHPRVCTRPDKSLMLRTDVPMEECAGDAVRREFNVKENAHATD